MSKNKYLSLSFLALISCLIVFIVGQFYIQENQNKYTACKEAMLKMNTINLKLNKYFTAKFQFIDFDDISKLSSEFEMYFDTAFMNAKELKLDELVLEKFKNLKQAFLKKKINIERFKSRQILILNSINALFEFGEELKSNNLLKPYTNIFNELVFMSLQDLFKLKEQKDKILKNLSKLDQINIKNKQLEFFIRHVKSILTNKNHLIYIGDELRLYRIDTQLNIIQHDMQVSMNETIWYLNLILSFFTLLIFLIIGILYVKNKKEIDIIEELSAFKSAVLNSDISLMMTDQERNITYINRAFETNTGYKQDEILGLNAVMFRSLKTDKKVYDMLDTKIKQGKKWKGEFISQKKDGSFIQEKACVVPIYIYGTLKQYLTMRFDISQYIKKQDSLLLFYMAFEKMQEGAFICDESKKILLVNKAFEKMTGYKKDELVGHEASIFSTSYKHEKVQRNIFRNLERKGRFRGKLSYIDKKGFENFVWANISVIKDENGDVLHYIVVFTNLKEIMKSHQRTLEYLVSHDNLTLLPNRVKLKDEIEKRIMQARQNDESFYLLLVDIDRFKNINDTLGHSVGDELLKIVSRRICHQLSLVDMVARFGGDEFVVVFDFSKSKDEVDVICQSILKTINQNIIIAEHTLNVSCSIGVCSYPKDGMSHTSLIKNADMAMYHAKKQGKNTYRYYDKNLSLKAVYKLQIEQILQDAIINEEFYLNYQPQYDLKTQEIISFESLIRLNNEKLGFIPPDVFIPISEDNKMIILIGKMVFEMSCAAFVEFKKIKPTLRHIAINISSIQFLDPKFTDDIYNITKKYNLKPCEIELEVTERYVFEYSQQNADIVAKLRELGFRFSVDDFGTGYSSMGYLTQFPIDVIKIDKSFIDGIPLNNSNKQIAKAITNLAKGLGCCLVAEGIEYKEQEDYLNEIQCDFGQGYLFSRPLSFDDAIKLLETKNV